MLARFAELMVESHTEGMLDNVNNVLIKAGMLPEDFTHDEDPEAIAPAIRHYADDKLITFDCECIEDPHEYATLLAAILCDTPYAGQLHQLDSELDHENSTASIRCTVNGEELSASWKQSNDWVASEFFEFVDQLLTEHFNAKLIILPPEDQCAEVFIIDQESGDAVSRFFARVAGKVDPDEVTGYKIMAVMGICFIAFLATLALGWALIGFWVGLGISLVGWGALCLWKSVSLVNEQEEHEAIEQELLENPEMIGKLAQEFMKELKGK